MQPVRPRSIVLVVLCAAIAAATPSVAVQRLGDDVVPVVQRVNLRVDPARSDYAGSVDIDLQVRKPVTSFRFHAKEMTLHSVELRRDGRTIETSWAEGPDDTIEVTAAGKLRKGEHTLSVRFDKPFNTQAVGLYRMEQGEDAYAFTQFQAIDARRAFPCWDEPGFKLPFEIRVIIPADLMAVSNEPIVTDEVQGDDRHVRFERSLAMPSYLVALAVGPFETVEIPGLGVPGRVVTPRGRKHLAGTAAAMTAPILKALEEYFGSSYPYRKLDLLAVPEFWPGAMENPGAVTFADRLLLLDPGRISASTRRSLARITAHELAHMWFGDLVTMQWWDDLWLNESFADWMGDKIVEDLYPELGHRIAELQGIQGVMHTDARTSTPPIRQGDADPSDSFTMVGLAYDKGKAVLGMFEGWVGEAAFRKGVRAYIEKHAWGNAVAADLWSALSKASGRDLTAAMGSFIEQPGVPLVRLAIAQDGGVVLRQERFHNHGVEIEPMQWQIPVVVKYPTEDGVNTRAVLLDGPTMKLDLGAGDLPAWILPDADARGYYRWSVPSDMLQRISGDAVAVLDTADRVGLVGNIAALLTAGEVDGGAYLRTLAAFASDPDPAVVGAVLSLLRGVRMAFVPADLEDEWAAFLRAAVRPALDRIGMETRDGEPDEAAILRPRLIALLGDAGGDAEVQAYGAALADRFQKDPRSVDPSLVGVALQLRAIDGDAELFDTFVARFGSAEIPAMRGAYLRALGSFEDPALRKRALAFVFEGNLRPNELFTIPMAMGDDAGGPEKMYAWVKSSYDGFAKRLPPEFLTYMPMAVSGCSTDLLEDARAFFGEKETTAPGSMKTLGRVAEQIDDCVALRAREGESAADYLRGL